MEPRDEIVIQRLTGPRLTLADQASKGELVAYHAGRSVSRAARAAVATRQRQIAVFVAAYMAVLAAALFVSAYHLHAARTIPTAAYQALAKIGPWSVDANGWTDVQPVTGTTGTCAAGTYNGTCIFYVSSAGTDDTTNCRGYEPPVTSTPATMCRSWGYALKTRVRGNQPDWMLLHRGETFSGVTGLNLGGNNWLIDNKRYGKDADNPLLIGAYPLQPSSYDDRPIVDLINCAAAFSKCTVIQQQSNSMQGVFVSIRFVNSSWDASSPNYWTGLGAATVLVATGGDMNFILIEDCSFDFLEGFDVGTNPAQTILNKGGYVRRNTFTNEGRPVLAFVTGDRYGNLVFEENLFNKDWSLRQAIGSTVSIDVASPATITFQFDNSVPPESGGMPPFGETAVSGAKPQISLSGSLPTGLAANSSPCANGSGSCYYLCNISGNTANLSASNSCSPLINTSGAACVAACTAKWVSNQPTQFFHNLYMDEGFGNSTTALATQPGTVFRNNITAYASATGSQLRAGQYIFDNLYVKNPIQVTGTSWPAYIAYNVMLQATDMQSAIATSPRGWGLELSSYRCAAPASLSCTSARVADPPTAGSNGTVVRANILAKGESVAGNGYGFHYFPYQSLFFGWVETTNGVTTIDNVICDHPTFNNTPYYDQGSNNTSTNNRPASNHDATCASLGLTPASVADYYVNVLGGPGGSTTDDFLAYAKTKMTKASWDSRVLAHAVNNYIRPTYGVTNPVTTQSLTVNAQ